MGCLKLSYRQEGTSEESLNFSWEVYKKGESAPEKCIEYYRYGFQGQFSMESPETTWSSFQLREYDAVIGRWLIPDPMKEFASPYVAMGNSPINLIDPTGGMTNGGDPPSVQRLGADAAIDFNAPNPQELLIRDGVIPLPQILLLDNVTVNAFPEWKGNRIKWGEGLSPQQRAQHNDFMSGLGAMYMGLNITLAAPLVPVAAEAYGINSLGVTITELGVTANTLYWDAGALYNAGSLITTQGIRQLVWQGAYYSRPLLLGASGNYGVRTWVNMINYHHRVQGYQFIKDAYKIYNWTAPIHKLPTLPKIN